MTKMTKNEVQDIVKIYNIPIAKLRILPKKNTFRPLMTFFRKSGKTTDFKKLSLNKILIDTHVVLRNLKKELFEKFGFSIFDNDHISRRYEKFVDRWKSTNRPKLYFLTMDIKKCYDSIDKSKLLAQIQSSELLVILILVNLAHNLKGR